MADVTFSTFRMPEYKRSNIPKMWNVVFIKTSLWVLIISSASFKEVHDWPLDCRHRSICVGGQLWSMMDSWSSACLRWMGDWASNCTEVSTKRMIWPRAALVILNSRTLVVESKFGWNVVVTDKPAWNCGAIQFSSLLYCKRVFFADVAISAVS